VFHNPENLESAIDELLSSGFDRAELSLLASEDAILKRWPDMPAIDASLRSGREGSKSSTGTL